MNVERVIIVCWNCSEKYIPEFDKCCPNCKHTEADKKDYIDEDLTIKQ